MFAPIPYRVAIKIVASSHPPHKEDSSWRTATRGLPRHVSPGDQFTYVPEENCYIWEGKVLKYTGINKRNNTHVYFRRRSAVASVPRRAAVHEASIGLLPSTLVNRHGRCPRPGRDTGVRDLATGSAESGGTVRRAEELPGLRRLRLSAECNCMNLA